MSDRRFVLTQAAIAIVGLNLLACANSERSNPKDIFVPDLSTKDQGAAEDSRYPMPLSASLRSELEVSEVLLNSRELAAIPRPVRESFARATQEPFQMAEPADPWNATDVVREGLSTRRLINVWLSARFCIVTYERGGIARTNKLAIFRLNQDRAELVWDGFPPDGVTEPRGLIDAIDQGSVWNGYGNL